MAAVGLVFAPLAPLVAVAACVVFWLGSFVYKYQLMFVYISRVESGGVSHPTFIMCKFRTHNSFSAYGTSLSTDSYSALPSCKH
jgi:hypothetical protein